jgi:hypothetical protein
MADSSNLRLIALEYYISIILNGNGKLHLPHVPVVGHQDHSRCGSLSQPISIFGVAMVSLSYSFHMFSHFPTSIPRLL